MEGSHRPSQWLLTQGCATAPPVISDIMSIYLNIDFIIAHHDNVQIKLLIRMAAINF